MLLSTTKKISLQKGMKKLLTKQKVNEGKITALGTHMVSIAQTTLKEIERLQKGIVDNNNRLIKTNTMCYADVGDNR